MKQLPWNDVALRLGQAIPHYEQVNLIERVRAEHLDVYEGE